MVEIIHRFNGGYPFGLQLQNGLTYVDLLKEDLSEQQINDYCLKYKILKEMNCPNIVKLIKILKDDCNMHLLYEYCPLSFLKYLEMIGSRHENQMQMTIYKQFINKFSNNINTIIDSLVHYQIKGDLLIGNMAIQQMDNEYTVKIFIDPDSDCMGLHLPISTEKRHNNLKQKIQQNRSYLREYYDTQKKRLLLQLEELLKDKVVASPSYTQHNNPNFIINGTKLVFMKSQTSKQNNQMKNACIQINKSQIFTRQAVVEQSRIDRTAEAKKQLKEKNLRKIEEIKKNLIQFENKKQHSVQISEGLDQNKQNKFTASQNRLSHNDLVFKQEQIANQRRTTTEERQCLLSLNLQVQSDYYKRQLKQKLQEYKKVNPLIDNTLSIPRNEIKQQPLLSIKSEQLKTGDMINRKQERLNKSKMIVATEGSAIVNSANLQQNRNIKLVIKQPSKLSTGKNSNKGKAEPQNQQNLKKKLRTSDITENKKKISEIIDRLNLKSNLAQSHSDKNVCCNGLKQQSKIIRQNTMEQIDEQTENFKYKIKTAKNKVQQAIKGYMKSKKEQPH